MNFYRHHIGDFDRATRHLSRLERSIYRDMLDVYYDTEAPLTLDQAALCRKIIARSNDESTAVEQVLNEFFTQTPTGWYHDRCEEELESYRTSTSQKSVAGKASAAQRALKRQRALSVIPTPVERAYNGTPTNQEPITINHKPVTKKVKTNVAASADVLEVFDYWKRVMGHHAAQLDTKRAKAIGNRLNDGYTVSQLCQAVDGCKHSPHHQGHNDTNTIYDDIELICRDGPKVDRFLKIIERGPPSGRSSNAQQTIDNLQAYLEQHEN